MEYEEGQRIGSMKNETQIVDDVDHDRVDEAGEEILLRRERERDARERGIVSQNRWRQGSSKDQDNVEDSDERESGWFISTFHVNLLMLIRI